MSNRAVSTLLSVAGIAGIFFSLTGVAAAQGATSYAAVPGQKGGQDMFGGYDVQRGWPKDISNLPGLNGEWTFGAGQSVFAESPDRVIYLQRGVLPKMDPPRPKSYPDLGPSLVFPNNDVWRNATRASLPANGGTGQIAEDGITAWIERGGRLGIDARWDYCVLVFDREGNVTEAWTQWDFMMQRPHYVTISPYDPEKHVWIIDDHKHVIHKFTNDGKTLVQTIGTYGEPGADETHFNRPTFMDFFPDGGFVVSDGYNGTRAVKFDADGNFVKAWGQAGSNGDETRPGYWNNVHGIAIDPQTNRVFVNDRGNRRIQVFDADGNYLYEWSVGGRPASIHMFIIDRNGFLWAADRGTHKVIKYDLEGNFLYAFGTHSEAPGGTSGVHGMSVDRDGNLYLAQVDNKGGVQKFIPRQGANPDFIAGPPPAGVW